MRSLEQLFVVKWIRFESNTSLVMRSNPAHQLSFLRSLDRFKVLIRVIQTNFSNEFTNNPHIFNSNFFPILKLSSFS